MCDERVVMVWQEFVFACAKYPTTDEAFLADIKRAMANLSVACCGLGWWRWRDGLRWMRV